MRVLMIPNSADFGTEESGIKRVCIAYERYGPQFGIEYVGKSDYCDLVAVHAGMMSKFDAQLPLVSHIHGLYWTYDHNSPTWEYRANANVITSILNATLVTCPSEWVAETLQRDMHVNPIVIHHGIEWQDWQHNYKHDGYILWNKNRNVDVCDPEMLGQLAWRRENIKFITTFAPDKSPKNVIEIGLQHHAKMKQIIQKAAVYLSTAKETMGIGALEALASGVPVLGFDYGGNKITVQHGVNGYLARPGSLNDLLRGLDYCLQYRDTLSANARELAKEWTWPKQVEKVAEVYRRAIEIHQDRKRPHKV